MANQKNGVAGFTLLELLVAMGIFMIICAAMFELLDMSQKRYNSETQVTAAYQDARLAMDQITRDFSVAGYPPAGVYSALPTSMPWKYATGPVAWSPNYPTTDCQIGVNCVTPGDHDLIIETRLSTDASVSWIWYHLDTTKKALFREVVTKTGGDPYGTVSSASTAVPLLANVMNSSALPIFQYTCDTPSGLLPCTSPLAAGYNAPRNIRDVNVTLIVATPQRDMQTQMYKLVELNGRGHRLNPDI